MFAISAAFGRKLAVATVLLYLAQGLVGLPVLRALLLAPYIWREQQLGTWLASLLQHTLLAVQPTKGWSKNPLKMAAAIFVADVVIFALGFAWLATIFGQEKAFFGGVVPFVLADLIKIALASSLVAALWQVFRSKA